MKKISEHLGEIIVALACVALLISAITVFDAPVSGFFNSIVAKETALGNEVMAGIENIDTSNIGVDGSGASGGETGGDEGASQSYQIIAGSGQTYSTGQLSFTSNAPYSKFAGVKVNGAVVDPVNYTVTEGSTIITFTEEYSQLLANGDYTIEVLATDGKASAPFDVDISNSVDTDDVVGTFYGTEYNLSFDEYGRGMLLVAAHGMEDERFEWELDANGDIIFNVTWVNGQSDFFPRPASVIEDNGGVGVISGNSIIIGDLTFTR